MHLHPSVRSADMRAAVAAALVLASSSPARAGEFVDARIRHVEPLVVEIVAEAPAPAPFFVRIVDDRGALVAAPRIRHVEPDGRYWLRVHLVEGYAGRLHVWQSATLPTSEEDRP